MVQPTSPRPIVNDAGNKNDVVIIGCKLPHGYVLELIPTPENTPNSWNLNWNPKPAGERVTLKGANSLRQSALAPNARILEVAKTVVNRSFWERWVKNQSADCEPYRKGFIFVEETTADFRAHAKEILPEKTGLEGLNPDGNDERIKKIEKSGRRETKIETDAEHLEKLRRNMDVAETA